MRQTVTETVYESWNTVWQQNFIDYIDFLSEKLLEIPEQHRIDATIEINSETDYDGHNPHILIQYTRPETDAETKERLEKERGKEEERLERERQVYEQLKKKFEK